MENLKPRSWHVMGQCFNVKHPDLPDEKEIPIPEEDGDISMDPPPSGGKAPIPKDSDHFGLPIDADLAVHFIQNLLPDALGFLDKDLKRDGESSDELADDQNINKLLFADKLINLTYGITFDKNIILKILSQPGCEGLRCYLCSRKEESKKDHYSLVLVGVNRYGYDLNFDKIDTSDTESVKTQSLIAEYGYPPNGKTLKDIVKDPHYVLLNLANTRPKHP
jgi:hypothetical protein